MLTLHIPFADKHVSIIYSYATLSIPSTNLLFGLGHITSSPFNQVE